MSAFEEEELPPDDNKPMGVQSEAANPINQTIFTETMVTDQSHLHDQSGYPEQKSEETKKAELARKRRNILILVGAIMAIIILWVIIAAIVSATKKSDDPSDPVGPDDPVDPGYNYQPNTYSLESTTPTTELFNGVEYTLNRDTSTDLSSSSGVEETENNQYIDSVTLRAYSLTYSTLRLMFFASDSPPDSTWVDQTFLAKDYLSDYYQGVKYIVPLEIQNSKAQTLRKGLKDGDDDDDHSSFYFSLKGQTHEEELLNTEEAPFVMMTAYQQVGFNVQSQKIFGIGERFTTFTLGQGNYTLYPYYGPYVEANGQGGQEQYGQHPLVVILTDSGTFFGIFLFNTNAQTFTVEHKGEGSTISFIATGGYLDFMILTGPTYRNVIQQYQEMVGFPKRLPYWANGFFTRSQSFTSYSNVETALTSFQTMGIPLDGYSVPLSALEGQQNLVYQDGLDLSTLQANFPSLYLVQPYTYLAVSETDQSSLTDNGLAVTIDTMDSGDVVNEVVSISVNGNEGICMDVFNPQIGSLFLEPQFDSTDPFMNGFWLEQNVPYVEQLLGDLVDNAQTNPYYDLPYVPGEENKEGLSYLSLPINAMHQVQTDEVAYHYDVHGLFGTEFAVKVKAALAQSSAATAQNQEFVISDSTFPGAGRYGVGHIFPRNSGSWDDLVYSLGMLVNFNMFGIPNVGANLGGYYTTTDQPLYAAYFQLAVVSPLAVVNDDSTTLDSQPFQLQSSNLDQVITYLQERLTLFSYMRTSLYLMEQFGGTLLRPLAFDYPEEVPIYPNELSQLMFGCCLMAVFQTMENQQYAEAVFPLGGEESAMWVELQTMSSFTFSEGGQNQILVSVGSGYPVPTFQKQGSIIGLQGSLLLNGEDITTIQDLSQVALMLSIVYDGNGQAEGYVVIEDGSFPSSGTEEFYFIKSIGNIINVKQQNNGALDAQTNKQISSIYLANIPSSEGVQQACVLLNDLQTVQTLVVQEQDGAAQALITLQDGDSLDIGDIAFIFYGTIQNDFNDNVCDANLFTWTSEVIQNDDQHYIATITQNIYNLLPSSETSSFTLNITLLGKQDVYINFGHEASPTDYVLNRNFSGFEQIATQYNIWDFLMVNQEENNFWFQIVNPNDPTSVILTSEGAVSFFGDQLYLLTLFYPNSLSDRFFGLGERKGPFFLQDQNWHALYSSNKRLENQQHSNGKYMQFCKSGYLPMLFSQYEYENNNLYTGLLGLQEGGGDYVYYSGDSSPIITSPQLSVLSSYPQDFVFSFHDNIEPIAQSLLQFVMIGPIYDKENTYKFPPPAWMFGSFVNVQDQIQTPQDLDLLINYYVDTLEWPIEGFLMSFSSLEGYESLSFNTTTYPDPQTTFQDLESQGYTMINLLQPGINIYSQNTADQDLISQEGLILTPEGDFLIGQDSSGTVYYPDYSHSASSSYLQSLVSNYSSFYGLSRTPFKCPKDEITNKYCKGDCLTQNLAQQVTQQFYRPGSIEMLSNLLAGDNLRAVGNIQQTHNLNGFLIQIQMANAFQNQYEQPIITDSVSFLSSSIGNAGHVTDYLHFNNYDAENAASIMQGLSMVGLSLIGMELDVKYDLGLDEEGLQEFQYAFETLVKVQSMMPLSFSSLIIPPQLQDVPSEFLEVFQTLAAFRYQFMRFMRTKIYYQTIFGDFYLTPLFYEFPNDDNTYDQVATQFMLGGQIMASVAARDTDGSVPQYFPDGVWCTFVNKYSTYTSCITVNDQEQPTDPVSEFVFLRDGSVVPVQDTSDGVTTSWDLENIVTDLHISFNLQVYEEQQQKRQATGLLFTDPPESSEPENYCLIYFEYKSDTMSFNEVSYVVQGTGECQSSLTQNILGRIYFYNTALFDFDYADVDPTDASGFAGQQFDVVIPEGDNPGFAYFDFSSMGIQYSQISAISFVTDPSEEEE